MGSRVIVADPMVSYQPKESAVMTMAIGWAIGLGGMVLAAVIVCGGWRRIKKVSMDWKGFKVNIECR
jgi:hypothetical protein